VDTRQKSRIGKFAELASTATVLRFTFTTTIMALKKTYTGTWK